MVERVFPNQVPSTTVISGVGTLKELKAFPAFAGTVAEGTELGKGGILLIYLPLKGGFRPLFYWRFSCAGLCLGGTGRFQLGKELGLLFRRHVAEVLHNAVDGRAVLDKLISRLPASHFLCNLRIGSASLGK